MLSVTAAALGHTILIPDPDFSVVTVVSTTVDLTIVFTGHTAPSTRPAPGTRFSRSLCCGGGSWSCYGPPGRCWIILTSTCHLQIRIFLPIIDLTVSPPVEAPVLNNVLGTSGLVPHVDDASHVDQWLIIDIPHSRVVSKVKILIMLAHVVHRSTIFSIVHIVEHSQSVPLIIRGVSTGGDCDPGAAAGLRSIITSPGSGDTGGAGLLGPRIIFEPASVPVSRTIL